MPTPSASILRHQELCRVRPDRQLLPISEAAARLGVTRARVDQIVREGRLPVVWVGHQRCIEARFVARHKRKAGGRKKL